MEQEILSTIQRNQTNVFTNDDLFTYEQIEAKENEIELSNNSIITSDMKTFISVDTIKLDLKQPIKSYKYTYNILILLYADESCEFVSLENKVLQKFDKVQQIVIHDKKVFTLENNEVKEYFNDEVQVVFFTDEPIRLIILKNDLYFIKKNKLFNRAQKFVINLVNDIFELKNNKFLLLSEKNKKIQLKLLNDTFNSESEMNIEEETKEISCIKIIKNNFFIATKYKFYIFKENFELIDLKEFNKEIKSFDVFNFRIKVLLGAERKEEKKKKKERYFNNQMESASYQDENKNNNAYRYQNEILGGIIDRLVNTFTEERKEREEKEKKRMESLLEKISEQLNMNLKLIVENAIKKEIHKISLRSLENSLSSSLKETILEKMVPILETSLTEMKIQSSVCKCSSNLYENLKRDDFSRGVELALDSNEEVFEEFVRKFDFMHLDHLSIKLVIELYKKCLFLKSEFIFTLREKLFEKIKNQKEFLIGLNEEILLLMPSSHLLMIINIIYKEKEYITLLEEIIKVIDITLLNDKEIKELSKLFDTIEKKDGVSERGLFFYCRMQRSLMRRKK